MPKTSPLTAVVLLAVIVGGTFFAFRSLTAGHESAPTTSATTATAPCFLYWRDVLHEGGAEPTEPALFPTADAALLYQAATSRGDEAGMRAQLLNAFLVPPGTRAEVLERKPGMRRVRVDGKIGWALDDICQNNAPR